MKNVATPFYTFGMLKTGRHVSQPQGYRYGFNGKENDNEVKGVTGSQQDYGMRVYDTRLGKFLSVDPITAKYPMLTPYQFASNRPIDGTDKDGLEWNSVRTYNPITGIFTVHNTLKIQIVTDGVISNQVNQEVYALEMKAKFEAQYTKFDSESNTQYTATLEYEFVNCDASAQTAPTETPFVVEMRYNNYFTGDIPMEDASGRTDQIGNTQNNNIMLWTGNFSEYGPYINDVESVANTFVKETGHTLGLLHPDGPHTNYVAPDIQRKHNQGTLDPKNFMYHGHFGIFGEDQIENSQLKGGTERIIYQQNDSQNASGTYNYLDISDDFYEY